MDFKNINDYELLYLIKEGNEDAIRILFEKYEPFIWKMARKFYPYGNKLEDLVQEGRIVLNTCRIAYQSNMGYSFYSFFMLCIKREFVRQMQREYYQTYISFDESMVEPESISKSILEMDLLFDTEEEKRLYSFCFLDGMSLSLYARKYNIPYYKVYYQYGLLVKKLKDFI